MPERERPSLSGLSIKRPLPDRGKPVVSIDAAESALLGDAQPAVPVTVPVEVHPEGHVEVPVPSHTKVQLPVLSPTLLKAKQKEIKIAWTFKIPHTLHQELSAVAAHNGLTMSDIVIEAIQFHLPNFPHPSKR
jgi:hypothetical protein